MHKELDFFETRLARYFPFGAGDYSFVVVVHGYTSSNGFRLLVTDPRDGKPAAIPASYCLPISSSAVHEAINGYLGWVPGLGEGVVVSGVHIAGHVYVNLFNNHEFSGLVPLTEVRFAPRRESSTLRVPSDYRT